MGMDYSKLWKLLIDKKMNKTQMRLKAGLSPSTLAKLGKNESVDIETLEKICNVLECQPGDIMEYIKPKI